MKEPCERYRSLQHDLNNKTATIEIILDTLAQSYHAGDLTLMYHDVKRLLKSGGRI